MLKIEYLCLGKSQKFPLFHIFLNNHKMIKFGLLLIIMKLAELTFKEAGFLTESHVELLVSFVFLAIYKISERDYKISRQLKGDCSAIRI